MLRKMEHGCTKGTNVLRPIECQKNVEHSRTDGTNMTRWQNKLPKHGTWPYYQEAAWPSDQRVGLAIRRSRV